MIKSSDSDFFYKGHCADLNVRLNQHNAGKVASTKRFAPFEFVYYESFRTREEAITREKYFKTAAGRRFLKVAIPRFQIPLLTERGVGSNQVAFLFWYFLLDRYRKSFRRGF